MCRSPKPILLQKTKTKNITILSYFYVWFYIFHTYTPNNMEYLFCLWYYICTFKKLISWRAAHSSVLYNKDLKTAHRILYRVIKTDPHLDLSTPGLSQTCHELSSGGRWELMRTHSTPEFPSCLAPFCTNKVWSEVQIPRACSVNALNSMIWEMLSQNQTVSKSP